MKTKHTPGPWTIDDSGMYLAIRGNLSSRKHAAHEEVVARPYHLDDARLIAAAPEMLHLLELVLKATAEDGNSGNIGLATRRMLAHEAAALIARARGES